jgi:hypothetical protein
MFCKREEEMDEKNFGLMRAAERPRVGLVIVVVLALIFNFTACAKRPSMKEDWRRQTIALEVEGFVLQGGEALPSRWLGTGIFITPDLLATSAHIVHRARSIKGKDDMMGDQSPQYTFSNVVYLDAKRDIAILSLDQKGGGTAPKLKISQRPKDPRALRGEPVVSIGNTAGIGLSIHEGQVTNVVEPEEGTEVILHSCNTAPGASGGPLFLKKDMTLLGVNSAISYEFRSSLAIPVWHLPVEGLPGQVGVPLERVFAYPEVPATPLGDEKVCLEPGEEANFPFLSGPGMDIVYQVKSMIPKSGVFLTGLAFLTKAGEVDIITLDPGEGDLSRSQTLTRPGAYAILVGNPDSNTERICLGIELGAIDWDTQLASLAGRQVF